MLTRWRSCYYACYSRAAIANKIRSSGSKAVKARLGNSFCIVLSEIRINSRKMVALSGHWHVSKLRKYWVTFTLILIPIKFITVYLNPKMCFYKSCIHLSVLPLEFKATLSQTSKTQVAADNSTSDYKEERSGISTGKHFLEGLLTFWFYH